MASILERSLARTVANALSGIFMDAVLTRYVVPTSPEVDRTDPPTAVPVEYTCKAIEEQYSAGARAQGLVDSRDVRILILSETLAVDPRPLDRIEILARGVRVSIVPEDSAGVRPVTSDPARATWACRCRS